MKILITGGAGFIGSHLAGASMNDGNDVAVVDNLSTGSMANIEHFMPNEKFSFVEGDIRDIKLIEKLMDKCDCVYHLAAAVGVQLIADRPVHTIETNIGGTEVVLDCANKFRKKILLASSSEVYGKSEKVPFCEDDDLVLGSTIYSRWAYACSKAIDEFLGLAFYQQYGLGVVIARFFNTIGPRQTGKYGMVVPRFVESALKNEPVKIFGDGKQSRCFCYVGDVVEAIMKLMNSDAANGRVYNVGSTEEITIEALADKVIQMTNSSSTKEYLSYEQAYGKQIDDMARRMPSIDRINSVVGWSSKTDLTKTLEMIIAEVKEGDDPFLCLD